MKKLLLIPLSIILLSCDKGSTYERDASEFNILIVEDCEYMYSHTNGYRSLVHKGNCKNKIHIYNKD